MSRLEHLKKFESLDNNQRIDALYRAIEAIVSGAAGETPDVTHHHDDRYLTRGEADERAGYVEVRIVDLERDRVANVERDTKLDHRVAVLEVAYGGGQIPVAPPPPAPAVPAIDPSLAAELAQRVLRIEQMATAQQASQLPTAQPQIITAPDARIDGLINDVATAIHTASSVREELVQLEQRMAGAEHRIAQPAAPANDDHDGDDLPAFLRGNRGPASAGVQMEPAHKIALSEALSRIDELEQAISRMGADVRSIPRQQPDLGPLFERLSKLEAPPPPPQLAPPMERIAAAVRRRAEQAPPMRVVEAAHLARNGQPLPIGLMQEIAQGQGCGWEDSALDIIRAHDRATQIAAKAYAVECQARRDITAGKNAEGVAAAALAAIEAIGG